MYLSVPRAATAMAASLLVVVACLSTPARPSLAAMPVFAGTPGWPPSTGLLVSEVATGGETASDEFVELYNAGSAALDLGGHELIYVTASGSSVTRKAAFAPLVLEPGGHLLVANAAGRYAATADATYSGGLAGDGGTVVLRTSDGTVVDALSWGSAANPFAEGPAAPAPSAGASLERRPGSPSGNWQDGNDNASDWLVRDLPGPQSRSCAPEPRTGPTTEASAPTPGLPADLPTEPASSAVPEEPTGTPAATSDGTIDVAAARRMALGSRVHLAGTVTASSALGSDVLFAVADSTAGIFVRPAAPISAAIGQRVDVAGILAAPYGQLEVRDLQSLSFGEVGPAPVPVAVAIAEIGEGLEGSLVGFEGAIASIRNSDGRLMLEVSDGASVRVMAEPVLGLTSAQVWLGERVRVSGVVGQHATATGVLDGYKVWLRCREDLVPLSSPAGTPGPGGPTSTPRSGATPTPTVYRDLASGLAVRGRLVDVEAIVTAAIGLVEWGGPTIVVDDGTAAVAVVLPATATSPRIGDRVRVAGKTGSYAGGPRVVATFVAEIGDGRPVAATPLARALGPADEWRLVSIMGRIERLTRAGSRWRADVDVAGHSVAVLGQPAAGISAAGLTRGRLMWVAGIVRRSLSDGSTFYVLPRNRADVRLGAPVSTPRSTSAASPGASAVNELTPISQLGGLVGRDVTVAGLVTAIGTGTALLDDGTGSVRLGGEEAAESLALLETGDAVEVGGTLAQDEEGLVILVDPERILSVAGMEDDATAGREVAPASASAQASEGRSPPGARAPALAIGAHGQARSGWPEPLPAVLGLLAVAVAAVVAALIVAAANASGRCSEGRGRARKALDRLRNTLSHA